MARRRHSNRRHRGGFSVLYKLLSILIICTAIIVALTLFFRVDTIVVSGQERYTSQEIQDATGIAQGDNLFLLNKYDVAQNIVKALPYVEEIRISRKLPDTLLIEVRECGTLKMLEDYPEEITGNTIYIIGAYRQPQYAVFQCPCGCGRIVELNLNKESSPSWALKWHVLGTISFSPSIWRKDGCRSHFFLKKSSIHWCP